MEGVLGFRQRWGEVLRQRGGGYFALVLRLATLRRVAGAGVAVLISCSAVHVGIVVEWCRMILVVVVVVMVVIMRAELIGKALIGIIIVVEIIGGRG